MSPKLLNILLVLIPVILYYGVFDPLYTGKPGLIWTPESSIASLQSTNVQYVNTSNLISEVQKGIKKIDQNYKAVDASTTKKMQTMLPDSVDAIKLKNEVIAIANAAGVSINAVQVRKNDSTSVPGTGSYIVAFNLSARYSIIKKLFEAYEKSTRFYTIESLSINQQEAKAFSEADLKNVDPEALAAQVEYRVYYLK